MGGSPLVPDLDGSPYGPDVGGSPHGPDLGVGRAVIFASKRNEAKRMRNFFRFDAKKSDFFACFASMRNIEI